MAKGTALLVLWLAVVSVEVSLCWGDEAESWTDWAKGKLNEGFGTKDAAQKSMDKAGEAASKATETMSTTAFDTKNQASNFGTDLTTAKNTVSDKSVDAKESVENAMSAGKDKASEAYNSVSDMANQGRKMVNDKAGGNKDNAAAATSYGEEQMQKAYEEAKAKAHGGYVSLRDVMNARASEINGQN